MASTHEQAHPEIGERLPGEEHVRLVGVGTLEEAPVSQHSNPLSHVIAASTIGNVLEWYDFGVFAFLAPQIASQFFPEDDKVTGILNAFIVFGGAFVMRPVGGVLFGHIGDQHGRTTALTASVTLMACSTFIIGCLPTHAQAGAWAPLALTLCRLLQGLSVGGELVGSMVFAVESAPAGREVLLGSLCMASAVAGTTLGAWTGLLLHSTMSKQALDEWGWRIPFWSGLGIGVFAAWMRAGLQEGAAFRKCREDRGSSERCSPAVEALRREPLSIALTMCITSLQAFGSWFLLAYVPVLYLDLRDPPLSLAEGFAGDGGRREEGAVYGGERVWLVHTLLCTVMVLCMPLWGWLGDRIGNGRAMALGSISMALAAMPGCMTMGSGHVREAFLGQSTLALAYSCVGANLPTFLVRMYPIEVRYSGLSVGYNVSLAIFGGTAGIMSTFLYRHYDSAVGIGAYLCAIASTCAAAVGVHAARVHRRRQYESLDKDNCGRDGAGGSSGEVSPPARAHDASVALTV